MTPDSPLAESLQKLSFPHHAPANEPASSSSSEPCQVAVFKRIEETLHGGKRITSAWVPVSRRNATQTTRQLQKQRCQALPHVHLFHPLLLTQSHPAGLSLIKTMLGEAHSHSEGDCSLLLPDCCDWLYYRIILENCFFYESKTFSSPLSLG